MEPLSLQQQTSGAYTGMGSGIGTKSKIKIVKAQNDKYLKFVIDKYYKKDFFKFFGLTSFNPFTTISALSFAPSMCVCV